MRHFNSIFKNVKDKQNLLTVFVKIALNDFNLGLKTFVFKLFCQSSENRSPA